MIWAFELLNEKQIKELEYLNPLMDFKYDYKTSKFYWQTRFDSFETVYKVKNYNDCKTKQKIVDIPVKDIHSYPHDDNSPTILDSYDYIIENIKNGTFNFNFFNSIRVVLVKESYFTIDKGRLKAFKDAVTLGYKNFESIPARIVCSLEREIRKIRTFTIKQVRQGFICDDWEEARTLSIYLQDKGNEYAKMEIEENYQWINNYLSSKINDSFINIIAIPTAIYKEHYKEDKKALELLSD